jgi:uncharacterized protein YebE (UPF0316 family)
METSTLLQIEILLIGVITLVGFFATKSPGFGKFSTSTLLMLVVVVVTSLLFVADKLDSQIVANIFFAVVGFAGGLFTNKSE